MQDPTGMHDLPQPHLRLAPRLARTRTEIADPTGLSRGGSFLLRDSKGARVSRPLLLRRIAELRSRVCLIEEAIQALERYRELRDGVR